MLTSLLLFGIGLGTGAFGTLLGLGGGFILVPILLFLYPEDTAKTITSISLAVVFFNALSGTLAYARMRRIDYKTGIAFALATVPGAVLGVLTTSLLTRTVFDIIFGAVLLAIASYLFLTPGARLRAGSPKGGVARTITDRDGVTYAYSFNLRLGIPLSFVVGFVSSLLGLGGGIIHVPALIVLFSFPAHVATATSHFILSITAFAGTATHLVTGEFIRGWERPLLLSAGVLIGAQVGAWLSSRVKGTQIVRLLAVALAMVGVRLLIGSL